MANTKKRIKVPGSGRTKGTPNKKSLLVKEILENKGINLVHEILKTLPMLTPDEKSKALISLMPYVYPKLAQFEITAGAEALVN